MNWRTGRSRLVIGATVATGLAGALLFLGLGRAPAARDAKPAAREDTPIANYRGWLRVTEEPQRLPVQLDGLCRPMTMVERIDTSANPHRQKYFRVFVNEIGREAMHGKAAPRFPAGSVIVKEKLPSRDRLEPELLTAMRKRDPGYDPQAGDWEYLALDGTGRQVQAAGRLENCRSCHAQRKAMDYVFRTYLTPEQSNALR